MSVSLHTGKMQDILPTLDAGSVDACVTDPPYELGFMGKAWDRSGIAFQPETWAEVYRVLKPGAYLLAFGGTRTYHRLTCAIEDAGWEVKDCLMWLHGQGFPKHKSLLKPAWEPIILAKKKGPGLLNIDGCRIGFANDADEQFAKSHNQHGKWQSGEVNGYHGWKSRGEAGDWNPPGRWPANVILDEDAAAALDAMSGERKSGGRSHAPGDVVVSNWRANEGRTDLARRATPLHVEASTGGASRFFYCAKASRSERNAGLDGLPERESRPLGLSNWDGQTNGSGETMGPSKPQANSHPCVKPVALMRWLVRLVTPPGGTILDPFTGSGSTGIAAALEGFAFTGIERDPEYVEIARRRIAHAAGPLLAMVAD